MPTTYRVGIIGCGSIARSHARGYQGLDNIEITAAADTHKDALREFCEEFGVPDPYSDYREMLDREHPDIVSVCTWHGLHAEMTIAAAEAGVKAVLCEKPMCVNLREADAMIDACEANDVKLVIGHQRRFSPGWTEAKRMLTEGVIGTPTMLVGRVLDGLLNWGTHVIDCMRYLLNDPETEWVVGQVERTTDRYERAIRIEDRCMGLICFNGGVRGLIESELTSEGTAGGCTVYGNDGVMEVDEHRICLVNASGRQELQFEGEDQHIAQARELVSWIEGETGHRGAGRYGRYAIEIMMAIYESARVHGLVRMPLTTKESPLDMMIDDGHLQVLTPGKYDIRAFLIRP